LIIQGHPDPAGGHLCHAMASAYAEGAQAVGHSVEIVSVATCEFPILQTKEDFESGETPAALASARDLLLAADHVVIIFPLWLGTMPALLKAFLEQLIRPGVAFAYTTSGRAHPKLKGKSALVVVTMGMPAWLYRIYFRAHGVKALTRGILSFVGVAPLQTLYFGGAEITSRANWERRLVAIRDRGAALR
jgi:putative NADPH-quinone reductase